MTTLAAPTAAPTPETPMRLGRKHRLAALAILFVLFTPYQTLVQTVITDDAVRKGIEADEYDMTWVNVTYGVGVLYGLFAGMSLSGRIGKRYTQALGNGGVLQPGMQLRRGDRARLLGDRTIRRGVRQDAGDGGRSRHALQAVRPRAAGGHRLLRRLRLLDAAHHAAGQRLPRRVSVVAVDVLGLCPDRVGGGTPGLAVHQPRPPAAAHAYSDRLAGRHDLRGQGRRGHLRLRLVPRAGAAGPPTPSSPRSPCASSCR